MYVPKLTTIAALLATTTNAIPTPNQPDQTPEPDHPSHPDPRFAHISLAHPLATIHLRQPTPSNNTSPHKRDGPLYGIYECSDEFFKGSCFWHQIVPGESKCQNRKYGLGGSFGPDKGVFCHVFNKKDCQTEPDRDEWGITYPGTGNCADYEPFNKRKGEFTMCPMSWRCDLDRKFVATDAARKNGDVAAGLGVPSLGAP